MSNNKYSAHRRYTLLMILTMIYISNGADRQLIAVLAEPIRISLSLSDKDIGLLSGFVFATFHALLAIPLARLADRTNRVRVISLSCIGWSLFTGLGGLAANFTQLALSRVGVAVGEAGSSPASCAMLADLFPRAQLGRALAVYSVGYPAGIALGTVLGGSIAAHYGWRAAFIAMSVPGVVLGLILMFCARDPAHSARGQADEGVDVMAITQVLRTYLTSPVLLWVTVAGCLSSFATYSMIAWLPAFLMRSKEMTLQDVASQYGPATGLSMIVGMLASGWLIDYFGRRGDHARTLVPALSFLLSGPLFLAAIWIPAWQTAVLVMLAPFALMMMWLPPLLLTIQDRTPPADRSTATAIFMLCVGLIGSGGGPTFVGFASAYLQDHGAADPLRGALTASATTFILAAGAHYVTSRVVARSAPVPGTGQAAMLTTAPEVQAER